MLTDKQGNKYYSTKEAHEALQVSRSTFLKMAAEARVQKYQMKYDRNRYYRVEDVEALKNRPVELWPVKEGEEKSAEGAKKEQAA